MRWGRALLILAIGLAGCSGENFALAPISGRVTLNGKAPPRLYVSFQPIGTAENPCPGPGSYAITDADGNYTLRIDAERKGAVVAKHRVSITMQFAEDLRVGKSAETASGESDLPKMSRTSNIPARYNEKSILQFDVPLQGSSAAHFELMVP